MMSETKKILLIGAGGHCLSVLDTLITSYQYQDIGIVDKVVDSKQYDNNEKKRIMGFPIVGQDEELEKLYIAGYKEAFITIGSIGDTSLRKRLYHKLKDIGFSIPNIIDRTSVVSTHTVLAEGIYIGKNSIVNTNSQIGKLAIINTSAIIEHECKIGDYVHIAPGAVLCGNVCIGGESHIGAGSCIKQGIHIGSQTMVGLGSVVLHNIRDNAIAFGNPCREVDYE